MSMLRAVIFDLDGVILDSEPLHFEADMRTMAEYGMEISEEVLVSYVGVTGPEMWKDHIERMGIPDTLEGVIARQKAHKLMLLAETKLTATDGIPELLEAIRRLGLKTGLASSSPRYFIEAVLSNLGIDPYFQAVVSGEEVPRGKPDPAVFLRASELLGVEPEYCLVIEDSMHGICAARAAHMRCVGFRNPTSGAQDLSAADIAIGSFRDPALLDLFA